MEGISNDEENEYIGTGYDNGIVYDDDDDDERGRGMIISPSIVAGVGVVDHSQDDDEDNENIFLNRFC